MVNFTIINENKPDSASSALDEKIALALLRLHADLENNGMEFLIEKMASENDYSEFIQQRRGKEIAFNSEDTESWYAYRYSDTLHLQEDKNALLELLANEKYADKKKYIYFCLSGICGNTNDKELFNFLIDKMQEEDEEELKVAILSKFRHIIKDSGFNIEPLKTLVKEGTNNECHAAIKALSNTNDPEVEDLLMDEFKITSTHMKGMICGPLSTVGTLKSIPMLKEAYKKTRDSFLRMVINEAVHKVETREGPPQ